MTDREIIAAIQAAALAVNPTGTYLYAGLMEASAKSPHLQYPLVHVARHSANVSYRDGQWAKSFDVAIRFSHVEDSEGKRLDAQSEGADAQKIIFEMEDLFLDFFVRLQQEKPSEMEIIGVTVDSIDPAERLYSAVTAGYRCRLQITTILTAPC